MSDRPAISVLLPVRDGGGYVAAAVGDVLAQRGGGLERRLELVAVDDGSRDGTSERLEAIAHREPRLRLIQTTAVGPARALDLAFAAARAPLIGQMEADDRCPPERFERLLAALTAHPEWHGVTSRATTFGFRSEGMRRYVGWQNRLVTPDAMARARFIEIPALHQTGLYRRAALATVGPFAASAADWPLDIDFWMRWFERGLVVGKVARVLYRWRQHERQSTRTSPAHRPEVLRRCKAACFARGPGRGRAIDLLSVGATLAAWRAELDAAGCGDLRAIAWKPGSPLPPTRAHAVRLFVYGTEPARARVLQRVADFDPARDWFAA